MSDSTYDSINTSTNSFGNISLSIRKLRKKLRQIEKLERTERELTLEEERKIFAKEKYREELQQLVKDQEATMVTLAETKNEKQMINELDINEQLEIIKPQDVKNYIGDSFSNGHTMNGDDVLNGHHIINDHHLAHHTQAHHLNGNLDEGFTLGFGDDGAIEADIVETNDISGKSHVIIPDDSKIEIDTTKKENKTVKKQKTKTSEINASQIFQDLHLKMQLFEGHHHDTCAVDLFGDYVISGGRDTSLKLWLATTQEELKSIGGHDGTITGVKFLKDQSFTTYPKAVTSSYDCSLKVWNLEQGSIEKSIYVYSPVICLDYANGHVAIGTEGGKVELYCIETGEQKFTVNAHDDLVSAIKILPNGYIVSGSADGILKIFDPNSTDTDKKALFTLDPDQLSIKQAIESEVDVAQMKTMTLSMTKISCIETYNGLILYGDEGFNIKALDYKKGEIIKMRNNLKEYSPTEALYIAQVKEKDFLFCVGSDVDNGDGFTNVRSLPDFKYMGTIRDPNVNSGPITSFCLQEVDSKIRFVTGGAQLRTWDEIEMKKRAPKRKNSSDEDEALVPCKFVCTYTVPRESEPESDMESDTQSESSKEASTKEPSADLQNSWCQIL